MAGLYDDEELNMRESNRMETERIKHKAPRDTKSVLDLLGGKNPSFKNKNKVLIYFCDFCFSK